MLFSLQTVTTLAVRPVIGFVSDRIGRRLVIVTGLAVCSGAVLLVSFAAGIATVVTAMIVYAAGVATTTAATSAFITDITRRERYGAAHGVFGTIDDIGDALGPVAAGFLVAALGYTPMFQIMATAGFVMALTVCGRIRPINLSSRRLKPARYDPIQTQRSARFSVRR